MRFSEKEKTPYEMLVYQIGWMDLLKSWDDAERAGQTMITPSEYELFESNQRGWAPSTPSRWLVWKWIHINTVVPFTNFRFKIRKWKRQQASAE